MPVPNSIPCWNFAVKERKKKKKTESNLWNQEANFCSENEKVVKSTLLHKENQKGMERAQWAE